MRPFTQVHTRPYTSADLPSYMDSANIFIETVPKKPNCPFHYTPRVAHIARPSCVRRKGKKTKVAFVLKCEHTNRWTDRQTAPFQPLGIQFILPLAFSAFSPRSFPSHNYSKRSVNSHHLRNTVVCRVWGAGTVWGMRLKGKTHGPACSWWVAQCEVIM